MDKPKLNLSDALMHALEFNAGDLEANRKGVLSEWQIHCLRGKRNKQTRVFLMRVIGASLLVFWCMLSANVDFMEPKTLLIPVVVAGSGFLYSSSPLNRGLFLHRDANRGKVGKEEGPIRLDIMGKERYAVYVGPQRFDVSKEVFLAFKNNDPYRLYYTPYSNTLVSAEWLYDGGFFDDEPMDEAPDEDDSSLGSLLSSQG